MKKILVLSLILSLFTGCGATAVRSEYNKNNELFEQILKYPISNTNRINLMARFKTLREKIILDNEIDENERDEILGSINYNLMILEDLE